MEQNQEMKLLLKQNSKALEFCLRGTLTLLRKKTHEYSTITMTSFAHTCLNAERKEKERDRQIYIHTHPIPYKDNRIRNMFLPMSTRRILSKVNNNRILFGLKSQSFNRYLTFNSTDVILPSK